MLVQMNWSPTARQLRQFGAAFLIVLPLVAWFWGASSVWLLSLVVVGLIVSLVAWFAPSLVRPVFIVVSLMAIPIGLVVGELVLMLLYLGLFVPIGMLFRITGRDSLRRRMNAAVDSHWSKKAQPSSARSYYRQF